MAITTYTCVSRGIPNGKREMTIEEFKRWLKRFDGNKDGKISTDELREAVGIAGGWFAKWRSDRQIRSADANGDGFFDDGEINNLVEFAQKQLGIKIVAY